VITTPVTFAASANCVLYQGGTPVFADIDPRTYNIAPDAVEKKITPRTRAVIPVHFTGQPCDLDAIHELARRNDLIVIEDAAHALGAEYKGRRIGGLSDMTIFSFHPVKHITTGEGGMITTNSPELYQRLVSFRNHGIVRDRSFIIEDQVPWFYEQQELGCNYRLTDIQAALGLSQLTKISSFLERRTKIVEIYNNNLAEIEELTLPYQAPYSLSAWHLYVIFLELEKLTVGRREFFEALRAENIGVNVHYIPVYRHPYYRRSGFGNDGAFCPNAEKLYQSIISLPLYPAMSDQDAFDVVEAVYKVIHHYRRR
jgi:dTDP-4-amino-4,6-dideoxygalactose transaminase